MKFAALSIIIVISISSAIASPKKIVCQNPLPGRDNQFTIQFEFLKAEQVQASLVAYLPERSEIKLEATMSSLENGKTLINLSRFPMRVARSVLFELNSNYIFSGKHGKVDIVEAEVVSNKGKRSNVNVRCDITESYGHFNIKQELKN